MIMAVTEKYIVLRWMIDHPDVRVTLRDAVHTWDCTVLYYSAFFRSFVRQKDGNFVIDVPLNRAANLYGLGELSDNAQTLTPYTHDDMDDIGVSRGYIDYGMF